MTAFEPTARPIGAINHRGMWTLYMREVRRFFKVSFQTILAPIVATFLLLAVFWLAFGEARGRINGLDFVDFVAPGLVMMTMLNNAFANSSSSMIVGKLQGNIVDVLMPPLSGHELIVAYVGGAATRGIVVGAATALAMAPLADVTPVHWGALIFHATCASILMGAVGLVAGMWADKFDHLAAVTNFIVQPLAMLSGTFYSVSVLPEPLRVLTTWNPIFYLIDGFRYGVSGVHDAPVALGLAVVGATTLAVTVLAYRALAVGYKIKS